MTAAVSKGKAREETQDTWVVLAYIVPITVFFVSAWLFGGTITWALVSWGLLLAIFGAVTMLLAFRFREETLKRQSLPIHVSTQIVETPRDSSQDQLKITEYQQRLGDMEDALQRSLNERDQYIREVEALGKTIEALKSEKQDADQNQSLIEEYQRSIQEQRDVINQNRQYISQLESKVQDLSYEVKTLLQLGDLNQEAGSVRRARHPVIDVFHGKGEDKVEELVQSLPSSTEKRVQNPYDARLQLEKCLETAERLTGASHLQSKDSRFRDLSVGSYALDLRRLFDAYRNETSCMIMMYSRKDKKLLFVNNQVKTLLGWSPEKFVKDFASLVQKGQGEWEAAISKTEQGGQAQLRLLLKSRSSKDVLVHCYLGTIVEGLFAGNAVAVLYPSTS